VLNSSSAEARGILRYSSTLWGRAARVRTPAVGPLPAGSVESRPQGRVGVGQENDSVGRSVKPTLAKRRTDTANEHVGPGGYGSDVAAVTVS
jgi:hypothetical protein